MGLVETVVRAIAKVRERNGVAPYDGWDAVYGEQAAKRARAELFEEAHAAITAVRDFQR